MASKLDLTVSFDVTLTDADFAPYLSEAIASALSKTGLFINPEHIKLYKTEKVA